MAASVYSNLFSNATSLVDAFVQATKPLTYDLYATTDVASLNILEKAWMNWYQYWGNPIIATGIMSFLLHEVSSHIFTRICFVNTR